MNTVGIKFDHYYFRAIRGAVAANNITLADRLIQKVSSSMNFEVMDDDILKHYIVSGIFEQYPKGDLSLLKHFKIKLSDDYVLSMLQGWAGGGHLDKLKQHKLDDIRYQLVDAVRLNRRNVINYYNLINEPDALQALVISGNVDLLPDLRTLHVSRGEVTINNLATYGYLEVLEQYLDLLGGNRMYYIIGSIMELNHLDVLDYLYKRYPDKVKERVDFIFGLSRLYLSPNTLDITIDYLFRNNIITHEQLKNVADSVINAMQAYNMDTANYLLQFK